MTKFTDIEVKPDGSISVQGLMDRVMRQYAQVAALTKDNDDIHELAEHYRVENRRLRELIHDMDIEHDMGWWSRSVRERIAALGEKP